MYKCTPHYWLIGIIGYRCLVDVTIWQNFIFFLILLESQTHLQQQYTHPASKNTDTLRNDSEALLLNLL
jgi:hypothetical protein